MDGPEFIPKEPIKRCPTCKDYTLFRYDHCENCGTDISDQMPIDPEEFLEHEPDYRIS